MKVALVYDRVNKWGGAERVLLSLQKAFPKADLFTSVYDKKKAQWAGAFHVYTSFIQKISFFRSHHEVIPYLMPLAFEQFVFDDYDLVISLTSEAAKGIITKPGTKHICICLTPTRYLWSGYRDYFPNRLIRSLLSPLLWYLQWWDKRAAQRPDQLVAISDEVRKRIKTYYNRDSIVIYPPVHLEIPKKRAKIKAKDYFLVISRLSRFTSYKRIDVAVKAATQLHLPLIVVGEGDSSQLKKIAGPTVKFVGKVPDEELVAYLASCRALIFPGHEDFGLVMAEAQLFGKPVIAYKKGGAIEIVREHVTGAFFEEQIKESLVEVLKTFDMSLYNEEACRQNAQRFSEELFLKRIKSLVEKAG